MEDLLSILFRSVDYFITYTMVVIVKDDEYD
jgi:hypothetical protein